MFDRVAVQEYARGVRAHARSAQDFARRVPERWSPAVTYQAEARDSRWWQFAAAGAAVGIALSWFIQPRSGARNRAALRNTVTRLSRRSTHDLPEVVARRAEYMSGKLKGTMHGAREMAHLGGHEEPADLDHFLAHKVETEVFRSPRVPKGAINIDSVDGVVTVRGTVENAEVMQHIVHEIERVDGVREVVNLMKTADEPTYAQPNTRR